MADLNSYLMAKIQRKKEEDAIFQPADTIQGQAATLKGQSPSIQRFLEAEEDYSPGSPFWPKFKEDPKSEEASLSLARVKGLSRSPIPGKEANIHTVSVAQMLRKMKNTEAENAFDSSSLKVKSTSAKTLTEEIEKTDTADSNHLEKVMYLIQGKSDLLTTAIQSKIEGLEKATMDRFSKLEVNLHQFASAGISAPVDSSSGVELDNLERNIASRFEMMKSEIHSIQEKAPNPIDRPTRSLISSMNDKLILLGKTQDHEFINQAQRLAQLEKKIGKLAPLSDHQESFSFMKAVLNSLDSKLNKSEREHHHSFEKLEKLIKSNLKEERRRPASVSDQDSDEGDHVIEELHSLKQSWEKDQKVTQDRMTQFIQIFSILQESHGELVKQLKNESKSVEIISKRLNEMESKNNRHNELYARELKAVSSGIANINQTLVSYLPLNLESKLRSIEEKLLK
jgi:hypothetical protein